LRHRPGVSTYLQTFILVAIALGGSVAVYRTVSGYEASASAPSLAITSGTISQGAGVGIETVAVANTGPEAVGNLTIVNEGLSQGASYCFIAFSASTRTVVSSSCPGSSTDPTEVRTGLLISPGATMIVEVTVMGKDAFVPGSAYTVVAVAQGGAQASSSIVAVSA
jgi:hypothetical protein